MVRGLVWVAVGLVAIVVLAWVFQRRLVYLPAGPPPPVEQVLPDARPVTLTTSDGLEHEAWFLEEGSTTVIVFPGNAGNRATRAPLARALGDAGFSVLLVDYRGYGGNPGSPTEEGLRRDAAAAVAWVGERSVTGTLAYYGESVGAGVATWMATEVPPDALILRSPLPSLGEVARLHYGPVPDALLRDRFDVEQQIADVEVPTLVVAGEQDAIVPADLSERVHEAAAGPSRLVRVPGAGHNDRALLDGEQLISAITELLRQVERGSVAD